MRYLHKKLKLEPHRVECLRQIGFEFVLTKNNTVKFSVVWDKSFQALKAFKDSNGHLEVPAGYKPQPDMAELDGWITRQRKHFKDGKLPDHLKGKLLDLGVKLGGRGRPYGLESDKLWQSRLDALVEYQDHNGDCDVPEKYNANRELGNWVKTQRDTYTEGMLPEDRVTALSNLGFNFYGRKTRTTNKIVDPWERRLSELQAYKDKTGNTNVPKKFVLNLGLGDFVYNQRMAYKHKKLTKEKIKSLEDMEFDWNLKTQKDKKKQTNWERRFDELVAYKSQNGDLDIPDKYTPNPLLAGWLKRQRKYHREGAMKPEKFDQLRGLGFDFGGPKQEKKPWTNQYEALVEFKTEHGHVDVPVHYQPNPPLYYWIGTQKQTYKKGKMPEDRINLLTQIGFDFSAKGRDRPPRKGTRGGNRPFLDPEEWDRLFLELEEYKEEHNGDCDVPQRSGRLGSFVHYMRFYVKSGKLSKDRIDRLNGLGFSWNVTEDRWNTKYEAVSKYKAEHGNFEMTGGHSLYNWLSYQRKLYAEANLPKERVEMLEKIEFDFQIPEPKRKGRKNSDINDSSQAWDSHFEDLMDFKDEHGHCDVPLTFNPNPALAKWVASQRVKHRKGSLKEEHQDLLNDIGFVFGQKDALQNLGVLKVPQLEPVNRESYLEDLWEKSYQEIAAYRDHFGHCNIPISYDANPSLGAWAFSQRMAFKKNKLSQDRIDKLAELGFSFGPKKVTATAEV